MGTLILWGLALIVLGLLAVALPYYFTISSIVVFGALLVASGLFWLFYHLQTRHKGAGGWLKPFILILVGLLFLLFPEQSIVVFAVFLLIYLLTDAFASLFLAVEYRGKLSSWFLMLLNALIDLILAAILLYYLPNPKVLGQIFGILIGVSLLIDGLLLLWFGWRLKLYYEKYERLLKEEAKEG
jgi:uncharacterized membrane protein HdeD (DUF308 family)